MSIAHSINRIASQKNIPLSVLVELTYRCNHRCYFCYQKDYPKKVEELTFQQWRSIFKQLADFGSLYLTISVGEPFIRNDILRIIEAARELNFGVSIITNGTLLQLNQIQALASLGIMDIGFSFHGSTAQKHDALTGVDGSYEKVYENLLRCKKAGIKTIVKHTVSNRNFGEYKALKKMSDAHDVLFECDSFVVPSKPGEPSVLMISLPMQRQFLRDMRVKQLDVSDTSKNLENLHCDAGRSVCGITPNGTVVPCIQLMLPFGNLISETISAIWMGKKASMFRKKERRLSAGCLSCSVRTTCSRCHGIALLETNHWRGKAPSLCSYALAVDSKIN